MQRRIPNEIAAAAFGMLSPYLPDRCTPAEFVALLSAPGTGTPTASPPPAFLTQQQACQALHISRPSLLALRKAGKIRTVEVGRRRLIAQAELEALAAGREG